MGMNAAQGVTTQLDSIVGPGLSAVWIGVLGPLTDGDRTRLAKRTGLPTAFACP